MEWFALIVPVIVVILLRVVFPARMTWWEFAIPMFVAALVILVGKAFADKIATMDTEYWGGWVTKAVYFEPWDEEVPCRHTRYRTNSKGERVADGYEHAYDVDYHGPSWQVEDSNGFVFDVSASEYAGLRARFGGGQCFVEMSRDFHSIDGDAYAVDWPGDRASLKPVTSVHSYENRVAKSRSVYSYRPVDPKFTPVFDYPEVDGYTVSSVVAKDYWPGAEELDKVNALLGASKKVRVWLIVWEGALDRQVGLDQEAYWRGGNKNELVICVNVNSRQDPRVRWCHVFSWSKSEALKTSIVSFVSVDNTSLNVRRLASFLEPEIESRWEKRNWHDFDYLSVDPPFWAVVVIWLLTIVSTLGTSYYCIVNQYEGDPSTESTAETAFEKWRRARSRGRF